MKRRTLPVMIALLAFLLVPLGAQAAPKKGLLVYDSIYGSTVEVAYWVKAIIGHEQQLDVKSIPQVLAHYLAKPSNGSELLELNLSDEEIEQLLAFLKTLN